MRLERNVRHLGSYALHLDPNFVLSSLRFKALSNTIIDIKGQTLLQQSKNGYNLYTYLLSREG